MNKQIKGPYEYGQDTETNKFSLLTTVPFIHILCSEASKLLLDCAPAFQSLLAKSLPLFKTKFIFFP